MAAKITAHQLLPLLFTLLLLVLVLSPALAAPNHGAARLDRVWKNKRLECERSSACGAMLLDEAQNCINMCISASCFKDVYGDMPLEDGEIDNTRSRQFTNCLRKEARDDKLAALKQQNQQKQQQQASVIVGLE